jgi:hypothetical protein
MASFSNGINSSMCPKFISPFGSEFLKPPLLSTAISTLQDLTVFKSESPQFNKKSLHKFPKLPQGLSALNEVSVLPTTSAVYFCIPDL